MDEVLVRDWCGWLNQGFLKPYNMRFTDSGGNFYRSGNHGYSSGEWTLLNEKRKKINEL